MLLPEISELTDFHRTITANSWAQLLCHRHYSQGTAEVIHSMCPLTGGYAEEPIPKVKGNLKLRKSQREALRREPGPWGGSEAIGL